MKKTFIIILIAALLFCFSACDEVNQNGETTDTTEVQENSDSTTLETDEITNNTETTTDNTEPETDTTVTLNPDIPNTDIYYPVIPEFDHVCQHYAMVGDSNIIKRATCETDGESQFKCQSCGEEVTGTIPALGHETVIDNAVAPSCTQNGKSEGSHCSRCNKVFVEQEVIPALGGEHIIVIDEAVEATCTQTGLSEGKHCSRCGKIYVLQVETPKLSHDMGDWVVDKEATCTEDGNEHYECANCDYYEEKIISATHKYSATEKNDKFTFSCTKCDRIIENVEKINILLQKNGDSIYTVEISGGYGKIDCHYRTPESWMTNRFEGEYSANTPFSFMFHGSIGIISVPIIDGQINVIGGQTIGGFGTESTEIIIVATDELGQRAVYHFELSTGKLISFENTIITN